MIDDFIPDFSEDDEEEEVAGVAGEQAQNRTFLIAAGILAAVFVLGLVAAVLIVLGGGDSEQEALIQTRVAENDANMTFAAQTQAAGLFTATPIATETGIPTATATLAPFATQTPVGVVTATEAIAAVTEVAEVTLSETEIAQGTSAPALEVTQLGGVEPPPTRIVSGINGTDPGTTTGGGVVATALPDTGFATDTPLATIGMLALTLVAVVFVARRLRVS